MRLTVLGGCGAWPDTGQACSGYLIEAAGFRLLLDPGYATLPRLFGYLPIEDLDAVAVTHGHPDHCADLNPLLRARALREQALPPLPVYALPGALDAVLALDRPGMLTDAYVLHEFEVGSQFEVGPIGVRTRPLPHFIVNAGMRLTVGDRTLVYTGDTGPSDDVIELARDADLLLADSTFVDEVPAADAAYLTSARQAAQQATRAGAHQLVLTHLWPGTEPRRAREAAAESYAGELNVARPGLRISL